MPDIKNVDKNFVNKETENILKFYNPTLTDKIKVYGLNWFEQDLRYVRFPKSSDEMIKKLAEGLFYLVEQPSGAMLAFYSNTTTLKIKVEIGTFFSMGHMAFTGQGGCDLYIGTKRENLKFFKTAVCPVNKKEYEFTYFSDWQKDDRLYLINLPLYGGVNKIEIGIDDFATINAANNLFEKGKVVVYGTSITQGGCASRPGISYTNALSRRMGYEFLNFGFSGNGRAQKEVVDLLVSINDVDMFILDYEANVTYEMMKNTLDNFILSIRNKYKDIPIVVVSKIRMSVETHQINSRKAEELIRQFQMRTVKKYQKTDNNIYFYDGHKLLGKYELEATVDGCHPNDLGFMMITDKLEKYLSKILK